MGYSRQEQETSIVWYEAERVAHVYTASPVTLRKLDKLAVQFPDTYRRTWTETSDGTITAAKYEVNARFIRFGKPASATQTEARRANAVIMRSALKTAL